MKNPWRVVFIILAIYLIAPVLTYAGELAGNQIPVQVGAVAGETNTAFVSVTVCEPGTKHCQNIDKIKLDTGSVGLRLYHPLNQLRLPQAKDGRGKNIFECLSFYGNADGSGGNNNWGGIRYADVLLGQEQAKNLRIQTFEPDAPKMATCLKSLDDPNYAQINGIMGIAINKNDCTLDNTTGLGCDTSRKAKYYTCESGVCSLISTDVAQTSVGNPISNLAADNSGYSIEFPALAQAQASVSGTLTFGIDSQSNNQLGDLENRRITLMSNGWLSLTYDNQTAVSGIIDSGSGYYFVPPKLGIATCKDPLPGILLCPTNEENLSGHFLTDKASIQGDFVAAIVAPAGEISRGMLALPNLGVQGIDRLFILGMPFFYGKKIFFGFPNADDSKNLTGFIAL